MPILPRRFRLPPRGELFLSLFAIGCAVTLPALALVWTTAHSLARGRQDLQRELEALRRLRLEAAVRVVQDAVRSRAHQAGSVSPVPVGQAGRVFRERMAHTTADGLLVLGPEGRPAYPALAIGDVETSPLDKQGGELMDKFQERFQSQDPARAYLDLVARFRERGLEGARTQSGRRFVPGLLLAALRQLRPEQTEFGSTRDALLRFAGDYEEPLIPASQRLFLWQALRQLGAQAEFATEASERLGLEVATYFKPGSTPSVLSPALPEQPAADVWQLPAPGGGLVWLYRGERLSRELEALANETLATEGYRVQLARTEVSGNAPNLLAAAIGTTWSGWELRLHATAGADAFARNFRRQAWLQVATAAGAVLAGAVLAFLAVRRFIQQVRITEVRHDFLTTVSHELRTPMTSIRMLVESLLSDPEPQSPRTRHYLEVVSRESQRLSRLVDDYLTFARLERGRMNYDFQPVPPEQIADGAEQSVANRFAAPGCEFQVEVAPNLPLVRADAPSLTTAVLNLLENAYKYTGAHKRILLSVAHTGDTVCFTVTDNGRGFDPAHRRRIFEKFYRIEERSGGSPGAGLGLHIVKAILDAHGGRVEVETTPGEGSRFALYVPVAKLDPAEASTHES